MNIIKKLLNKGWVAGTMFLLLIFALPGLKSRAESFYYVDYSNEIVYIQAGDHKTLYFAFAEEGKTPTDKNFVPVMENTRTRVTQIADGNEDVFCIDLSAQSFKRATRLYYRFDGEKSAEYISFEARKSLKAVYCGTELVEGDLGTLYPTDKFSYFTKETGYYQFYLEDEYVTYLPGNIEWRAGTAMNYRPITELNLNLYLERGATLYFRYNSGGSHISKEAKVKLRSIAKAPSVKIDGQKMSISLKDNMEYRVVADGEAGAWSSVEEGKNYCLLKDMGLPGGDGNFKAYTRATVEVRVKATKDKHASRSCALELYPVTEPVEGREGITVSYANPADVKKGLLAVNHSEEAYQVAILPKSQGNSLTSLLFSLNAYAKKGEYGYIAWKNVPAGGKTNLAYTMFKDFESYWILYRKAPVKENSKTPETEFRTASVIKAIGGRTPECDTAGGTVLLEGDSESRQLNFTYDDDTELYISVDGGANYQKSTDGRVSVSGSAGDTVTVMAYTLNPDNSEKSTVKSITFRFVRNGELEAYRNKWGYASLKKLDAENNTNSRQLLYQRIYLAFMTYEPEVNYSDLSDLKPEEFAGIISCVATDNPLLIQVKSGFSYTSSTIRLGMQDKALCERLLTQCDNSVRAIETIIAEKYGSLASAQKVQIVKEIHDYIILKKEYKSSIFDQTMVGALADEYTPVCMSYTLAMKYCCEYFGIQCEVVFGNVKKGSRLGEMHSWNLINYGNTVDYNAASVDMHEETWYELDATWDDPVGAAADYVGTDYFNVTTAFMATSRVRNTRVYPSYPIDNCTATDLSYGGCVSRNLFN